MFNIYLVKYLNTFDIFESFPSGTPCIDDLGDIALDIEDDNFISKVSGKKWASGTPDPVEVSVFIHGSLPDRRLSNFEYKEFYICDISQCVQRMVDYMRSEGYFAEMYVLIVKDLPVGDQRSYLAWNDVVVPLDRSCLGGRKIKYLDITFKKVEI